MVNFNFGVYGQKDMVEKEPEDVFLAMETARDNISYETLENFMNEIRSLSVNDFIEKIQKNLSIMPDMAEMVEDLVFQVAELELIQEELDKKELEQQENYDPTEEVIEVEDQNNG
jgi:hypothetical protein